MDFLKESFEKVDFEKFRKFSRRQNCMKNYPEGTELNQFKPVTSCDDGYFRRYGGLHGTMAEPLVVAISNNDDNDQYPYQRSEHRNHYLYRAKNKHTIFSEILKNNRTYVADRASNLLTHISTASFLWDIGI